MSDDLHSPTSAGPQPPAAEPAATTKVHEAPAGSGLLDGGPVSTPPNPSTERPEVVVGAAFAGGVLAALILKRFGRHD